MNSRIATSALALALTFGITGASNAAGFPGFHGHAAKTTTAAPTTGKMISFNLRNDAKSALIVQLGDQQVTIEPGKTSALKAQDGQQIVAVNAAGHVTAGEVLGNVNSTLRATRLSSTKRLHGVNKRSGGLRTGCRSTRLGKIRSSPASLPSG